MHIIGGNEDGKITSVMMMIIILIIIHVILMRCSQSVSVYIYTLSLLDWYVSDKLKTANRCVHIP